MFSSARRQSAADGIDTSVNLLPFLDIIFAVIGIFIIVFAFQEIIQQQAGRALAVDHYVLCTSDKAFTLYSAPDADPASFSRYQFPQFFRKLQAAGSGVRNIVLAFDAGCFTLQGIFVQEFDRYTATLDQAAGDSPTAFRLALEPLPATPAAVEDTLRRWRGESGDD